MEQASVGEREKVSVALKSALAAVGLTTLKAVVGLSTGSLGILAEAAHSGLDLVAALVTYFAVRVASKPPDLDHTYGHGKVENFSALFETLLLIATCVWVVSEAVKRLASGGVEIDPSGWAFGVMFLSIVVDYTRSRSLARAARKYRSQALEADALHFSTDIWSSSVVILGLVCVWVGERWSMAWLGAADSVAALGVSAIVVWVSFRLGRRTLDSLLDRVPPELSVQVQQAALAVPGVVGVTRVRVREVGGRYFVDLLADLDRKKAFERAEAISAEVEREVRRGLPEADVVVHARPVATSVESAIEKVQLCAARLDMKVHNVVVFDTRGRLHVNYHLEVPDDALLDHSFRMSQQLEALVRQELPESDAINVHFDPRSAVVASIDSTCDLDMRRVIQEVRNVLHSHSEILDVHDLVVHRVGVNKADGSAVTDIACHCSMPGDLPVRRIHELDDQLQNELRDRIPSLRYLFIQPEPAKLEAR